MAQQIINNGESGLVVRTKLNDNFTELYTEVAAPITAADVTNVPSGTIVATDVQGAVNELDGDIQVINDNFASAVRGNVEDMLNAGTGITLTPSGTGATRQLEIAATGGGGGIPSQIFASPLKTLPGVFIANVQDSGGLATVAQVTDTMRIAPFLLPYSQTIDQVGVSVSTGVAGNCCVVIFDADSDGRPTTLLAQSPNISTAAAATLFATQAFTFTAHKLYWMGVWSSATATLRTVATTANYALSYSNAATPAPNRSLARNLAYGTATNWPTYANSQLNTAAPALILMRTA